MDIVTTPSVSGCSDTYSNSSAIVSFQSLPSQSHVIRVNDEEEETTESMAPQSQSLPGISKTPPLSLQCGGYQQRYPNSTWTGSSSSAPHPYAIFRSRHTNPMGGPTLVNQRTMKPSLPPIVSPLYLPHSNTAGPSQSFPGTLTMPTRGRPSVSRSRALSSTSTYSATSPPLSASSAQFPRKRSRQAWSNEMTRHIIRVLVDEFANDPCYQTKIYSSRDRYDDRFEHSGRSSLEEYNKVQNVRRRYFLPLGYLLQWYKILQGDCSVMGKGTSSPNVYRAAIEKKLDKPLEFNRLKPLFESHETFPMMDDSEDLMSPYTPFSHPVMSPVMSAGSGETFHGSKPKFEQQIFIEELQKRDLGLWNLAKQAYFAWTSRKVSLEYILN